MSLDHDRLVQFSQEQYRYFRAAGSDLKKEPLASHFSIFYPTYSFAHTQRQSLIRNITLHDAITARRRPSFVPETLTHSVGSAKMAASDKDVEASIPLNVRPFHHCICL